MGMRREGVPGCREGQTGFESGFRRPSATSPCPTRILQPKPATLHRPTRLRFQERLCRMARCGCTDSLKPAIKAMATPGTSPTITPYQ